MPGVKEADIALVVPQVGVANYHLRSLSSVLRSHGVEYEQAAFGRAVQRGDTQLTQTLAWLKRTVLSERVEVAALKRADIHAMASVPKLGVILLCLNSESLSYADCPETLRMDLMRVVSFQNEVRRLAVVAAMMLVVNQIFAAYGVAHLLSSPDEEALSLPETLYLSLQRPEIRLPTLIEHVVKVAENHMQRAEHYGTRQPTAKDKGELDRKRLRHVLEKDTRASSPVFKIVVKRMGPSQALPTKPCSTRSGNKEWCNGRRTHTHDPSTRKAVAIASWSLLASALNAIGPCLCHAQSESAGPKQSWRQAVATLGKPHCQKFFWQCHCQKDSDSGASPV